MVCGEIFGVKRSFLLNGEYGLFWSPLTPKMHSSLYGLHGTGEKTLEILAGTSSKTVFCLLIGWALMVFLVSKKLGVITVPPNRF